MSQQINLYQPMFRRQEKVFSAMTMVQTIILFAGVLTAIYFYGQYRINPLENQLEKTRSDVVTLRSRVDKYKSEVTDQSKSQLLDDEIARLENELKERRKVKTLLDKQQIGSTTQFSDLMEALARQHVDGTWLTEITITSNGKALSLNGKTLASSLVPKYVQRLGEETVMKGIAFNNLELKRATNENGNVRGGEMDFQISTN